MTTYMSNRSCCALSDRRVESPADDFLRPSVDKADNRQFPDAHHVVEPSVLKRLTARLSKLETRVSQMSTWQNTRAAAVKRANASKKRAAVHAPSEVAVVWLIYAQREHNTPSHRVRLPSSFLSLSLKFGSHHSPKLAVQEFRSADWQRLRIHFTHFTNLQRSSGQVTSIELRVELDKAQEVANTQTPHLGVKQ